MSRFTFALVAFVLFTVGWTEQRTKYKLIDFPRLRLREEGAFRGGSANTIIVIIITIHINLYNM